MAGEAPAATIRKEKPRFGFPQYGIAFHLAAEWCGEEKEPPQGKGTDERALVSYQDDMLLFAHRDEPPFRSRVLAHAIEKITVGFPPVLVYESEGATYDLLCADAGGEGRTRSFGLSLVETFFERSEIGVLTLVLEPLAGARDTELNEYDVIKLAKLWEGGEGVEEARSAIAEDEDVEMGFTYGKGKPLTLHEFAAAQFPDWQPLAYTSKDECANPVTGARTGFRVGTVELELEPDESRELFVDIANVKSNRKAPTSERRDRVVAVGGMLQGLLDFRAIEDYELADVFATVDVDAEDETMRAFHKGTLLSLSTATDSDSEGEGETRPEPPLGVDPYLVVPNIVLLHNEHRLKTARLRELHLSQRQHESLRRFWDRAGISETEEGLGEIARQLAQHLPNVFHYESERELQRRGQESRGLDDLETFVRLRIDDLTNVLQSRQRTRDRWTAILGIAVGVVTAFLIQQAIEGQPLLLIFVAAIAVFGAFLLLRERLF